MFERHQNICCDVAKKVALQHLCAGYGHMFFLVAIILWCILFGKGWWKIMFLFLMVWCLWV